MANIRISLSSDQNYFHNVQKCLLHLNENANPEIKLDFLSTGFDVFAPTAPQSFLNTNSTRFMTNFLNLSSIRCLNQHKSPQYGDFLAAYPNGFLADDDIIIFIDGDVILQRPFSDEELNYIKSFKYGDFGVNFNASETDSIWAEASRLICKQDMFAFTREWWPDNIIPRCYNTGCCIATVATWRTLAEKFITLWKKEGEFIVYPNAQWLMSWLIQKDSEFTERILPLSFHTHAHFGLYPGVTIDNDGYTTRYNNKVVAFRHKIAWQ
jgi:lipopolysaccharide biosynthesis glycosyltransferase